MEDCGPENFAGAKQFSRRAKQNEGKGESDAGAEAVEEGCCHSVFARKCLRSSEKNAIDDYKGDEYAERSIQGGHPGVDHELEDGDERSYHDYEGRDPDFVGHKALYRRNDDVGANEHDCRGDSHHQSVVGGRGGAESGTHSQKQHEDRVSRHDAII